MRRILLTTASFALLATSAFAQPAPATGGGNSHRADIRADREKLHEDVKAAREEHREKVQARVEQRKERREQRLEKRQERLEKRAEHAGTPAAH